MNLYLLSQSDNDGYDVFDSCVVVADSEESARLIAPSDFGESWGAWAVSPDTVQCTYVGTAAPGFVPGTILISSFNAG